MAHYGNIFDYLDVKKVQSTNWDCRQRTIFLPNRIIASNIGFQRPVTSSLHTAFTRLVVGPTNLKRQKRRSLRSGESNGMQYVWVKVLVFTNTPDNQRASCSVFSVSSHSAMFKCGGLWYNSTLSKFSWPLCWYSCNFRESEINVWPPELASWPPRMKKDEVLDILAVSEFRIIPATCRSWSFFEPMLMIYVAQWDHL